APTADEPAGANALPVDATSVEPTVAEPQMLEPGPLEPAPAQVAPAEAMVAQPELSETIAPNVEQSGVETEAARPPAVLPHRRHRARPIEPAFDRIVRHAVARSRRDAR